MQILGFVVFGLIMLVQIWPSGGGGGTDYGSASTDIAWDTYDVTIDVREDGSIHVTESQEIQFDGRYTVGFAEIPMERIESIDNVSVTVEEGVARESDAPVSVLTEEPQGDLIKARQMAWTGWDEQPNTFRAEQDGGMYVIEYAFDATPRYSGYSGLDDFENGTRTIVLEYDAYGVIRDYPDAEEPWQQIHWMGISRDVTSIAPVRNASVTVNLPVDVPAEDLVVAPEPDSQSGSTIVWTRSAMDEGDAFDVQAAFPTITDATSPSWQEAADARDASIEGREQRRNAGQLMLILAGIAILVGGALAILYAWYRGIREPHVGPVHETVTHPPGELPGVLVGSLMDESVDPRDIAAGVLDLDRQGIITIRQGEATETESYYLTLNKDIPGRPAWSREMLRVIFGDNARRGTTKGFSALRDLFGIHRETLQKAIDQSLVDDGYYEELPEISRKHWTWVTYAFVGAAAVAAIAILLWARSWTWLAVAPILPGVVMWWFGRKLTPHVAQKTRKGAEVAALWRAFERHMTSTGGWRSAGTQASVQAEYGPWLTAFGLERGWLAEMNTSASQVSRSSLRPDLSRPASTTAQATGFPQRPSSTRSLGQGRDGGRTVLTPPSWRPSAPGWDAGRWRDMQSVSNSVGSTLSSMSDGAFSMIGDMLESLGESSGSSGGSSGRRSSFRGSSSRSGGGRSRSSSGGGRRGFR
jgi:hypothetical protein